MKRIVTVALVLVFVSLFVQAAKVLVYNETDYINLRPVAYDHDNDSLTYYFDYPLSSQGTWQTQYGDQGTYNTTVTVSDGRLTTKDVITIVIKKKEEPPQIEVITPRLDNIEMDEHTTTVFKIDATDKNQDQIFVEWYFDGETVAQGMEFSFTPDFYAQGKHHLLLVVSDGTIAETRKWNITINDVDRNTLLDLFQDQEVDELDTIELPVGVLTSNDLEYSLSEPFSHSGIYQTDYDSAGTYTVELEMWDEVNFTAKKTFKIKVNNVDRPPICTLKEDYKVSEGETINIPFNCTDPDGDDAKATFSFLPTGAIYEEGVLTWTPDFDFVINENIIDDIARRYHLMKKDQYIWFNVSSNLLSVPYKIKIIVYDTNRAPTIQSANDLVINEGQRVDVTYAAKDPDQDALSYSLSGPLSLGQITDIGDVGSYKVKLVVSDGFLEDSEVITVTVNAINHAPEFAKVDPLVVEEGQKISIDLKATDKDNDLLTYSSDMLPTGAILLKNKFIYIPPFDIADRDDTVIEIPFTVTDGNLTASTVIPLTVINKNRPPVFGEVSYPQNDLIYVGEKITLNANVFDPDLDNLTYTWSMQNRGELSNDPTLEISFDSTGTKKIMLLVTDQEESIRKDWEIDVQEHIPIKVTLIN